MEKIMAKRKIPYFTQSDWMNMERPKKLQIMRNYLNQAKDYLANIKKSGIMNQPKSQWIPYSDPSMSGRETAKMMLFQNVMRPTGIDLSDSTLRQTGQNIEDKLNQTGREYNSDSDFVQRDLQKTLSLADALKYYSKRRRQDFTGDTTNQFLRMLRG
jgi:hypothetical protein